MIYPTINDLSKDQYNRYEIALATAKCARMITNEYVRQRKEAERAGAGTKDGDRPLTNMIDREVRDEKAVKLAIGRIHRGEYDIVHKDPAEQEREEREMLEGMAQPQEPYYFTPGTMTEDSDEDVADEDAADGEIADGEIADETVDEAVDESAEDAVEDAESAADGE